MSTPSPFTLPPETATFVGREAELERLRASFDAGHRLVLLTGPLGVGKRRLALRLAHAYAASDDAPGDVLWCDLGDVADIDGAYRLAASLDAGREGPRFIVLCRGEHLGDALGALALQLSASARVLLVARERTGASTAPSVCLAPLDLEPNARSPSDAIRLLLDRAIEAGFEAGCDGGGPPCPSLHALASTLGGNPLALELAARRLGLLMPCTLLPRVAPLEQHLEWLGGASVAAELERASAAMPMAERTALARLSVFAGPFDLEAAEMILAGAPHAPAADDALTLVERLIDRSQLVVTRAPDGRGKALVVPIFERAFARRTLARDMAALRDVTARHAAFAEARARRWAGQDDGDREACALELIEAAEWALRADLADGRPRALRLLTGLRGALGARTLLERALPTFHRALEAACDLSDHEREARTILAEALYLHGRGPEARTWLGPPTDAHAPPLTRADEARRVCSLGASHFYGEGDAPSEALAAAIEDLEAAGHTGEGLDARMRLARALENRGEVPRARRTYEEALHLARALGEHRRLALIHLNLGALEAHLGEDPTHHYRASLALARELSDRVTEAVTLSNLGIAAFDRGSLGDARACFTEALALEARIGMGRIRALATGYDALALHLEGAPGAAVPQYRAALAGWHRAYPDPLTRALFATGLALAAMATGDIVEAERQLADLTLAAERHPEHVDAISALIALAELGPARAAAPLTPAERDRRALALAAPLIARLAPTPRSGAAPLRAALRLLGVTPERHVVPTLTVSRSGHRFITPDGVEVDLGRRGPARRILTELATRRARGETRGVDVESLFTVAWPGEKVAPPYRANRVYVAIAELRRLGLEPLLKNDGEGYVLDPAVRVELLDDHSEAPSRHL